MIDNLINTKEFGIRHFIAKRMVDEEGIDSLILGCTELPLILTESRYRIPFLNTSAIHCESIIAHCIKG
jgi:aspartate racemase